MGCRTISCMMLTIGMTIGELPQHSARCAVEQPVCIQAAVWIRSVQIWAIRFFCSSRNGAQTLKHLSRAGGFLGVVHPLSKLQTTLPGNRPSDGLQTSRDHFPIWFSSLSAAVATRSGSAE